MHGAAVLPALILQRGSAQPPNCFVRAAPSPGTRPITYHIIRQQPPTGQAVGPPVIAVRPVTNGRMALDGILREDQPEPQGARRLEVLS